MALSSDLSSSNPKKNKKVSETGHAKNVANFQDLILFVTGYGASYNPTKNNLKLPQLTTIASTSQTSLADVITKNTTFNNKVNDRAKAFSGLKPLSTRLINALATTDASSQMIKDAKGFNRKLQGKRASAIETNLDLETPAPITISSSQQSYDQQIQHFAGLISVLQSETSFAPNETELSIATITALKNDLAAKNNAVASAYTSLSNARINRNKSIYAYLSGLVDVALEVKNSSNQFLVQQAQNLHK